MQRNYLSFSEVKELRLNLAFTLLIHTFQRGCLPLIYIQYPRDSSK